jgi:hypothetical protein
LESSPSWASPKGSSSSPANTIGSLTAYLPLSPTASKLAG